MSTIDRIIKHITRYDNHLMVFFFISLFFFKLPSFYIFSQSTLTSTHTIFKLAIIAIFPLMFIQPKKSKLIWKSKSFIFLTAVFVAHSLSVINTENISFFFRQYQNLLLDVMIFTLSYIFIQSPYVHSKIFQYMFVVAVVVLLFELIFFFIPDAFITFFTDIVPMQQEFMNLYIFNLNTLNRHNLFLHSELFYPFFLYPFLKAKDVKLKWFCLILTLGLFFVSIVSKFRTRLVQSVFAVVGYIISLRKNISSFVILGGFISMLFLAIFISFRFTEHAIFDRIIAPDEREDIQTLSFRRSQLEIALSHVSAYPLFGVGLGNYKSYIDHRLGRGIHDSYDKIHYNVTIDSPHSIFIEVLSETGVIGTISYVLLLGYFMIKDIKYYLSNKKVSLDQIMPFIIASWTVFLYGIMNPFNTVFLNGWFWFLRGIVEGNYVINESKK